MNRDLGIVRKIRNRFQWPLGEMEEGDFFTVLWQDAHSSRVRNSIWKLAKDRGLAITVRQCEDGTKVTALPREVGEVRNRPMIVPWRIVKPELERAGLILDWENMAVGEAQSVEREGEASGAIVTWIDGRSFLVENEAKRLVVMRLPDGMNLHSWAWAKAEARRMLAD